MMEQWEVQRGAGVCAGSGRKLEPGEEYIAVLVDKGDRFERQDYSLAFWEQQRPEVFSFWKTRIPEPNQKKKLFVDDGVLINFFERLGQETEPLKVHFRFVLALILLRKKLLKYVDTRREDGREIWRMRLGKEDEVHEVVNPHLTDEQIQEVSGELSAILQGEL